MSKKIFRAICGTSLLVLLLSVILILGALYNYFTNESMDEMRIQLSLAVQGVQNEGEKYLAGIKDKNIRLTWINKDGSVIYDTQQNVSSLENHKTRSEVAKAFKSGYGESMRYSKTMTEQMLYAAQRLSDGTVLRIAVTRDSVILLLLGSLQPICIIVLVLCVLSAVLASRLSKQIVKPIDKIDLDNPEKGKKYEEFAPLLNRLSDRQEEMRKEFTTNVSHELKTPLHSISGYAELMKNKMVKEEDYPVFAGKIYDEAQRMSSLISDIISLSHLDSGAVDEEKEKLDLLDIARDTAMHLENAAKEKNVTITVTGEHAEIYGKHALIETIISNLADNAVKYNKDGGSVDIEVKKDGKNAVIEVKDTGIGIPEEDKNRIFERFYRVDKSRSREIGGTGLGLSIVKHAVMIHNGTVSVDSVPGKGSTFTVVLPEGKQN